MKSKIVLFIILILGVGTGLHAQVTITPVIYPQYSTDSSTGGRLPYIFRAKLSGLAANTVYRFYARACNPALDAANAGWGTSIFLKSTGSFLYVTNPNFFNGGSYDTLRSSATGEYTGWFAFEPGRVNNARFNEGNYIHAKVFLQPNGGGPGGGTAVTITDSILNIKIGTGTTNATGVYSTSLAPAKDPVFLYDNENGTGRPLAGMWIESDGLDFKTGTGFGGTPNATAYPAYYKSNTDAVTSAWGSFIPNTLANGLRRVERRALTDGTIAWFNTDANGIWDSNNANTVNPNGGQAAIEIATDDAPLVNVPPKLYFVKASQTTYENAGTVSIGVGIKFPSANPTSVDVAIASGTASAGSDYTYSTQTVTFPANSSATQNVTFTLVNDAVTESIENVILKLQNFTNSSSAGTPANDTLTIVDDDAPYVSFNNASGSGIESTTSVNIPVNIMFPNSNATSVFISVTGGSASLGSDYTFSNQTLTFPASSSSAINVPLTIINDAVGEPDETIEFTLSAVTNGATLGISKFTYTIQNDDIVPVITFRAPTTQNIKENAGTVTVQVSLSNPALTATSVTISGFAGSATLGSDYSLPSNTITFPANTATSINYTFPITDDALVEQPENIVLRLTNPSIGVTYVNEFDTINITDNDLPYYLINQINHTDPVNGIADSLNVRCELHGVIYGPNVRPGGLQFFINDRTGGIQVLRTAGTFGYVPAEGDSIVVKGDITQAAGQLQITNLDTVYKISSGNALKTPTVITSYSEANEGNYVTLQYCHLVNPAAWPTGAGNAAIAVVDQNNKQFMTQIFRQTDIDSTQPTQYWFHVSGILAQNDNSLPWDTSYYLIPLHLSNYEIVYPRMSFATATDTASENIGLDSMDVNLQWAPRTATSATVSFTGGSATFGQDFNFTSATINFPAGYAVTAKQRMGVLLIDDVTPEAYENILLTILGPTNGALAVTPSVHSLVIRDNDGGSGINTHAGAAVSVYPNPSNGIFTITSPAEIKNVRVTDMTGRVAGNWNSGTIDLSGEAKGMYMIEVTTTEGISIGKVTLK